MKLLERSLYRTKGEAFNSLMHAFLLYTLVYGVMFTFFADRKGVQDSVLYILTHGHFGSSAVSIWGIAALLTIILVSINLWLRKRWAGVTGGYLGFMIWIYAFIVCLSTGFFFQAMLALVQIYFWVWHTWRIERYYYTKTKAP